MADVSTSHADIYFDGPPSRSCAAWYMYRIVGDLKAANKKPDAKKKKGDSAFGCREEGK